MSVAGLGPLKFRRALVEVVREVVPVALDLFELGRESEIVEACNGNTLADLLRYSLVDYRNRYTDTRREELIRRDVEPLRSSEKRQTRALVCLFCATLLAMRATTAQSYRIARLMLEEPNDDDRDISGGREALLERGRRRWTGFHVKISADPNRLVWCVADVREAIRPHVVTCALTSLGCLQVPQRPGVTRKATGDGDLFDGVES